VGQNEAAQERRSSGDVVAPLPPGLVPGRRLLEGRTVRVEPIDPGRHAEDLYSSSHGVADGEAIWRFLGYGPWPGLDPFRAWLRDCAAQLDPIFYAIRLLDSGRACGMASYLNIVPRNGSIEVGHIWFAPSLQRTVAATEALFLMLRYAMDDLRYRRIEWKCDALNERSRRAALRLGFRFEGIFYQHMIIKGCNRDTAWYSILDHEWPTIRARLETWLAPENFDAAGRQIGSLSALNRPRQSPAIGASEPG
jgi:RimJ/RimL family protein N-acetyltransferase